MQEMFMNSINVPVELLREHTQMGLNERELVILLRLLHLYYSKGRLNIDDIAAEFTVNEEEAASLIGPLIAKEILLSDAEGISAYTLDGLFVQLYELWAIEKRRLQKKNAAKKKPAKAEDQKRIVAALAQLYRVFERELGRNLSPIENDKISQWLEQERQSPELIMEALRRAVLHGKSNFAYIDKILFNWRKQGLQTPAEVEMKDIPSEKKQSRKNTPERIKDTYLE